MPPKKPRVGPLLLMVAVGAGVSGYFLGRFQADGGRPSRAAATPSVTEADYWDEEGDLPDWDEPYAEPEPAVPADPATEVETESVPPSELLDALRRHSGSDRSQKILLGMVADAARVGGDMLPEIQRLLESGDDIAFSSYDPRKPGYPSLRVALLAAAEATGAPEAVQLISEVAHTTESPVEVVFSAHLLDRLDALDQETAQRTLDSLATNLSADQKKAMASVVRQVLPAVARTDPEYAENFLATQLRITKGPRADPRLLAPVLDGLPLDRASNMVLNTVMAPDVTDRAKMMVAARAAQRELPMLQQLRQAIESNALPPKVSATIARSAMSSGAFGRMERWGRKAAKSGNLEKAHRIALGYQTRLEEAYRTVGAARNAGAKIPKAYDTRGTLHSQRLDQLRGYIQHAYERRLKQQAKEQKQR